MLKPGLLPLGALIICAIAVMTGASRPPQTKLKWYKGNTHTHTLNSDGDSTPDEVVRWYREHGYHFVVLTDHNYLTSVDGLNALHGADEKFLVIKGEEVTDEFDHKPLHLNGLDPERAIAAQHGVSVADTLQRNVDAIRAARGVPHINHPNFHWAITADDLLKLRNDKLFEIYNGHPEVNNLGGGGLPGLEEMWDIILTNGKLLYGIAVDDAHHFKRPWDAKASRPGKGWVYVRAERLSAQAILAAMERGDFYASTGVELADYEASDRRISVKVKETGRSRYRIQFIGNNGRLLKEAVTSAATYDIQGSEGYVRARAIESNGGMAWMQPVLLRQPR